MVWFQCEDCGENLKKPKLANHFRICSAHKLSCIDCGQTFSQQSVQSHTQCITEAEKYGPKGQGKAPHNAQSKPDKPKPNSEVDINVGLSSRAPWFCSLCKTSATSMQTLMLHADGKKHRAKARAYHAAQKQSSQAEEPNLNEKGIAGEISKVESVEVNGVKKAAEPEKDPLKDTVTIVTGEKENTTRSKRKHEASSGALANRTEMNACDLNNGEVIQAEGTQHQPKKKKCSEVEDRVDKHGHSKEASQRKIKWKKLVTSTLKSEVRKFKLKKVLGTTSMEVRKHPEKTFNDKKLPLAKSTGEEDSKSRPQIDGTRLDGYEFLRTDLRLMNDQVGVMKIRKLQKLVIKALQESGVTEDESKLGNILMEKINSSSRFIVDNKHVRLAPKIEES